MVAVTLLLRILLVKLLDVWICGNTLDYEEGSLGFPWSDFVILGNPV